VPVEYTPHAHDADVTDLKRLTPRTGKIIKKRLNFTYRFFSDLLFWYVWY